MSNDDRRPQKAAWWEWYVLVATLVCVAVVAIQESMGVPT